MQDFSDKLLDDRIASALESQTYVSTAQKQMAWERLHTAAKQQSILAAYTPAVKQTPMLLRSIEKVIIWLDWLIFEETHYETALNIRREHYAMSYAFGLRAVPNPLTSVRLTI
jgi:hypothetical protein